MMSLPPGTHFFGQLKMAPGAVLPFRYAGSVCHTTVSCTNDASPYSMAEKSEDDKTQYIINIAVFARVLEKHVLLPTQWPGAYKTTVSYAQR